MDHKAALAALSPQDTARLNTRSDRAGLRHLAGHLGLIGLTGLTIALAPPLWWLALPVHGVLLSFLFTLEHEATHQTPFATPWLNETVGHLCALVLLLPFTWFRYFHLAHHRHTNDPEKDPELASPKPQTWPQYALHLSGWGYWKAVTTVLVTNAFGQPDDAYLPARTLPRIRREARLILALYAAALLSLVLSPLLLWLWIVPMLLGQPALRLYLLAEHGRCPPVANMLENTRTTYTSRAIRFIAWNMPYHAEHHAAPQVPFHQLPALNAHLAPHLKSTSNGYTEFHKELTGSF